MLADAVWYARSELHMPTQLIRDRGIAERLPFGTAALITYLILEDQRRMDVLGVLWVS
jgi:hypothetical protein